MSLTTTNPATGEVEDTFDEISQEEVQAKLKKSIQAFRSWQDVPFEERSKLFQKMANHLENNARKYGEIITKEMGKPISSAVGEVEKCAWNCKHYAEKGVEYLESIDIETESDESFVRFDPLGPILLVMPWNYPFWQVLRMGVPVLMAGNTIVLKHASNVPQCAQAIENIFHEVGFPEGVFQNLPIRSKKVDPIIKGDIVRGVSLTGSVPAGGAVAKQAGAEIKKTVLELGGSDPFIVLEDADVEHAANVGCKARLKNCGQSCIAAKRFIVEESVADDFTEKLKFLFEDYKLGDPMQEDTDIGPLSSEDMLENIKTQVNESVQMGATVIAGGEELERQGYYYKPTILTDITDDMPVFKEETFGPVATIRTVEDEQEAVEVANNSEFGLGAAIFSQDIEQAKQLIPKIDSGMVFVNEMVATDPRMPTGGVKKSGYGRELGEWGIKEFTNKKTVSIDYNN